MRIFSVKFVIVAAAAAAALCFGSAASHAGMTGDSQWCAVTNQGSDALDWDCEYETIDDCRPAVLTGNRGFCAINPYWRPVPDKS